MKKITYLQFFSFLLFLFPFALKSQIQLPYVQSFDTGSTGWTHYTTWGQDDWQIGTPAFSPQTSAYSNPTCWGTNLTGNYSPNSIMYLQSPSFDFSSVTQPQALQFYSYRIFQTGTTGQVQSSIDGGATWTTLFSTNASLVKNWYTVISGFSGSSGGFQRSCYSLASLSGQPDVRIRFVLNTGSTVDPGWLIDDFSIADEYFNIYPSQGDSIKRFSAFMPTFSVKTNINFQNQYSASINNTINYYFSNDAIYDGADTLLGTFVLGQVGTFTNYTRTLNTPPNLHAGYYYIFIKTDALNVLAENDEADNVNVAVLKVDSTLQAPYADDFENDSSIQWTVGTLSSNCSVPPYWSKGTGFRHHLDGAHSEKKAWNTCDAVNQFQSNGCGGYVESPFIDISSTSNPVVAFWYKDYSGGSWLSSNDHILYSTNGSVPTTQLSNITLSANDDWDFKVISLSALSAQRYLKFAFNTAVSTSYNGAEGLMFDDIYIGPLLPDLSIEGEKDNRFTSSASLQDTLKYKLVNSGSGSTAGATTYFFWSADSIRDASDVFLGSKVEPIPGNMSSVWTTFAYTKPTTATGNYYIFYVVDSANVVAEMREYNNVGCMKLNQQALVALPYYNDFETQITGWFHNSSLGADDWNWGAPTGTSLTPAFSGTNAWITNANGDSLSPMSRYHLYTPLFDFTTLPNPVLEFDMINLPWGVNSSYWVYSGGNMSYSVDGGATWTILDTTSQSFKEWYYQEQYEDYGGIDRLFLSNDALTNQYLFSDIERVFVPTSDYQTRDTRRTTHYVLDIGFLAGQKNVQFRFNYTNFNSPDPGMLMDNFSIGSRTVDLTVAYSKKLMMSSQQTEIRFYTDVLNNGNYISQPTTTRFFLSADTIQDASDNYLGQENIPALRPEYSKMLNVRYPCTNLAAYNYLLIQTDFNNSNAESNESNNLTAWPLNVDTIIPFPYLNDFSDSVVDGWTWYNDDPNNNTSYHNYRFRHKKVVQDNVYNCQSDEWFLDRINNTISSTSSIPIYYLETPLYNFSPYGTITLDFDYLCIGNGGSNSSGGNLQYSLDGGNSWQLLNTPNVTNALNWYNCNSISTLGGQQGWNYTANEDFVHCHADISFLAGQSKVRFRFAYKSFWKISNPGNQGFRLDNFEVNANAVDYVAIVPPATTVNAQIAQPYFPISYEIQNTGNGPGQNSYTKVYWSTDTILDAGDSLLYSYFEPSIVGGGTITSPRNIYYPVPVTQLVYYLFYFADGSLDNVEVSEQNNVSYFRVVFDSLSPNGIMEHQTSGKAVLFANNGHLFIGTQLSTAMQDATLSLFDATGNRVFFMNNTFPSGTSELPLPVELSDGIYFLKMENGSQIYFDKCILIRP